MLRAKPWPLLLICAVRVAAGLALVLCSGHPAGALGAVLGLLFAAGMPRARFSRQPERGAAEDVVLGDLDRG
jgi:uncharacterized protein (DUF58 family)